MRSALTGLVLACLAFNAATQDYYSPGGWPTLHQDPGNRRFVNVEMQPGAYEHWNALAGASVLTAPVTSPDGRSIYVTTGLASGNSNLHAFSIDGELLWQSQPWLDADRGVDPCAILSSPIVDTQGDIYISDCNQLFAFRPNGDVKWVAELPEPQPGDWVVTPGHPVNAFTTAVFTANGHILGVTNFGDVVIIERSSGKTLNRAYRLPATLAPYAEKFPLPDSLLADGMIDPQFREWAWQVIFAGNVRSGNTPAVADSGRVYVVGSSATKGIGALFGLDIDTSGPLPGIAEGFVTEIGIGSGSSPALSPDGNQVYVSDEEGWFYGIDATSGSIAWQLQTAAAAGAAAVGDDGVIYALQVFPAPAVVAISPAGKILWQSDLSNLLGEMPSSFLLGDPVGVANGNPVVTRNAVLVPVIFGYQVPIVGFTAPVHSAIVALDAGTGKATHNVTALIDDSSGITAILPDGTLINSLGGLLTSAVSPASPLLDLLLPGELVMMKPAGGIQVSTPAQQTSP